MNTNTPVVLLPFTKTEINFLKTIHYYIVLMVKIMIKVILFSYLTITYLMFLLDLITHSPIWYYFQWQSLWENTPLSIVLCLLSITVIIYGNWLAFKFITYKILKLLPHKRKAVIHSLSGKAVYAPTIISFK